MRKYLNVSQHYHVVETAMDKLSWNKIFKDINEVSSLVKRFRVDFIDEQEFLKLFAHLKDPSRLGVLNDAYRIVLPHKAGGGFNPRFIYLTGFLGTQIRDLLCEASEASCQIKVISRHNRPDILRKMAEKGIKVGVNKNAHARLFIAYADRDHLEEGLLVLGFDFDLKGLSGERKDAGIITRHPDLIQSAVIFFERIWNDETQTIPYEMIEKKQSKAS